MHCKSKCPTAWAVMQEQHQAGSKVLGKEARAQPRVSVGSARAAKAKAFFLGRCFQCCEPGHCKQDCTQGWRH